MSGRIISVNTVHVEEIVSKFKKVVSWAFEGWSFMGVRSRKHLESIRLLKSNGNDMKNPKVVDKGKRFRQ